MNTAIIMIYFQKTNKTLNFINIQLHKFSFTTIISVQQKTNSIRVLFIII